MLWPLLIRNFEFITARIPSFLDKNKLEPPGQGRSYVVVFQPPSHHVFNYALARALQQKVRMPSENSRPRPRPIPIRVRRNGPYVKISQNPGLTVESNGIRPEEQTRWATFDEPGRSSVTNVLQRQADQDAYYNKQRKVFHLPWFIHLKTRK